MLFYERLYNALAVFIKHVNEQSLNTKSLLLNTYNLRPRKPISYKEN